MKIMALGLPVVATAAGGTPEVVGDGETGVLVNHRCTRLALVLHALIRDVNKWGRHKRMRRKGFLCSLVKILYCAKLNMS